MIAPLPGLSSVADRYDAVLCDVWGVVHNGVAAHADACEALSRFQAARGPVVLISNAPRPGAAVIEQFEALGVPGAAWAAIVTSGDATREDLRARGAGPAWAIGPVRDVALFEGLPLKFVESADEAAFVACTGLFDDETETPEDYRDRLARVAERRLPFVCANPDRVVQRGGELIWCGGALADLYAELLGFPDVEAAGELVVMLGKPYAPIYALAMAEAERLAGRALDRSRVLCIGDGLATDVRGANRQGLDCLFVGSGIHGGDTLDADGRLDAERTRALLESQGAHAACAMAELAW